MNLSPKELEVYNLIHLTTRQIAFELDMMDKTVKFHKTNIYKKLGVKGAWEIICRENLQAKATAQKRTKGNYNQGPKSYQTVQNGPR